VTRKSRPNVLPMEWRIDDPAPPAKDPAVE
jgi:hypothetical protein